MLESFWDDYDLLADNIESSGQKFFANNLARWFLLLGSDPVIAATLARLEHSMNFKEWYAECERTMGGMVGSGTLEWPLETKQRLGAHLFLMRSFSTHDIEVWDFASTFLYSQNHFDAMTADIIDQIFQPLRRELRQFLERATSQSVGQPSEIPASDRTVSIDHNAPEFKASSYALDKVEQAIVTSNVYDDPVDKEQRLAELSAGKKLLSSVRVRVQAIQTVLLRCLKYLAEKFIDNAVGILAMAALTALATLLGII